MSPIDHCNECYQMKLYADKPCIVNSHYTWDRSKHRKNHKQHHREAECKPNLKNDEKEYDPVDRCIQKSLTRSRDRLVWSKIHEDKKNFKLSIDHGVPS